MRAWLSKNRFPLAAFLVSLAAFAAVAGRALWHQSSDPHFVLQANAWLDGRLSIEHWPKGADDPTQVETVELVDDASGTIVRGRRVGARGVFRVAGGREVPLRDVKRSLATTHYVSFPPLPSVLLLPQVALAGAHANDVVFTVFWAALAPALLLLVLRRLRALGLSARSEREDLWFAALLAFGTVFFFSAVQGRVWFTAHVIAVDLCLVYVLAALGAAHPVVAGLALACAFVTRAPLLFMFPFFLWESWRAGRTGFWLRLAAFAAPILVIGSLAAWHNMARFGELGEFGHAYLAVRQKTQIDKYGLFNFNYLSRNLATALTLLPKLTRERPYMMISGHGLAMWFTTPALLLLLWPRENGALHRSLWITAACVALWSLLYQNSGWLQFGYRFSLDYLVFLLLLLVVGARPLTRTFRGLIVLGIAINLFGAITFHRHNQFYMTDDTTYRTVIAH